MNSSYAIQLIAPSGYCQNQPAADLALSRLAQQHQLINVEITRRREQRFAGSDQQRLTDINQLAHSDPRPDIVLAVRGGYGASRLLDKIDYAGLGQQLAGKGTIICGHSDFTAIQLALLSQANLITFSGPMLAANFGAEQLCDFTQQHFWQLISADHYRINWSDSTPLTGQWQGQLWGGNLAMLTSLLGTPWMPTIENGILVIEDINEQPFRVERMLLQLHYAGILAKQQAIITGSFSHSQPSNLDGDYNLDSVWDYLRQLTGIPIINHLEFGHEQRTVTLPIGATARLIASHQQRTLRLSGYPTLKSEGIK